MAKEYIFLFIFIGLLFGYIIGHKIGYYDGYKSASDVWFKFIIQRLKELDKIH